MYLISAIPAAILGTPYFDAPRCTMLAGGEISAKRRGIIGKSAGRDAQLIDAGEGGVHVHVRSSLGLVGNDFLALSAFYIKNEDVVGLMGV